MAQGVGEALLAEAPLVDVTENVVRAAGGLVWRRGADAEIEVALVHRSAYDDWTFPKGKLHDGESEQEAALREVEEETGLRCRLGEEVGVSSYRDSRGRPKTVRYWAMSPVAGSLAPTNEIDAAAWVRSATPRQRSHIRRYQVLLQDFPSAHDHADLPRPVTRKQAIDSAGRSPTSSGR